MNENKIVLVKVEKLILSNRLINLVHSICCERTSFHKEFVPLFAFATKKKHSLQIGSVLPVVYTIRICVFFSFFELEIAACFPHFLGKVFRDAFPRGEVRVR